jgi:radical SAM superfamily enzyme YgiQ (UPF0313 family)
MKSVVLIYPSHKFGRSVQPRIELPVGLLTVGTPLDEAGYRVRIIDQRLDTEWKAELADELGKSPVCVGVSCMTGPQIHHGLEASRIVKSMGDTPVVWGGIHPTLLPEQTVEHEDVDIVVQGEGEETFLELVQALDSGSPLESVKSIWYKEGGELRHTPSRPFVDLNEQQPLAYHLVDLKRYLVPIFGKGHLSFETSRGCPFRCTYCYNTNVYQSTWRGLSVEETIRRLKLVKEKYNINGVLFSDDNFFGKKERSLAILRRMKEEKLDIQVSKIDAHINILSKLKDDEMQLIADSGCRMLMIGVETGSDRIIEMMRKELKIKDLLEFNRRLPSFGIMALYFFMMGYPTETEEELRQTIEVSRQLARENEGAVSHMNIYTPFPGTGMFDIAVENGLKCPEKLEDWVPFNYRTVNESSPWLSKKQKKTITYKKTSPLIRLMARLYYPVALKRVEKLFYHFPIEIRIAEWLGLYPRQY